MAYTLITGASSGIGRELTRIAAREGRDIVAIARDKTALDKLADELAPVRIIVIAKDLSRPDAADELAKELKQKNISVDTLINNAGVGDYGELATSDGQRQLDMINLNVTTLTLLTRLLLPDIIRHKGRIMNVSSVAGFLPGPYMSVYYATKAYVRSFSESLHAELKAYDVSVTCLAPGPVATHFAATAHLSKGHVAGRAKITPDEVAAYGWSAMMRGQAIAIYGAGNKVGIFVLRLLPLSLVRWAMLRGNRDHTQSGSQ